MNPDYPPSDDALAHLIWLSDLAWKSCFTPELRNQWRMSYGIIRQRLREIDGTADINELGSSRSADDSSRTTGVESG